MIRTELPPHWAIRPLEEADLPALHRLLLDVTDALADPASLGLSGGAERFFASHCGQRGQSLGIFDADRLVAYGALTLPEADDSDNYANDLGWEPARAARAGLLSAAMVHPGWRGYGLHCALIRARLARAAAMGREELLARAAPANDRSRRNLLHQGFAIVWLGVQAPGALRHILWRPTSRSAWTAPPRDAGLTWVAPLDLPAQTSLLTAGQWGVRTREADDWIGFATPADGRGGAEPA